jgi:predicted amidohydrolase
LPESSDFIADPSAIAESSGNSWEAVETFHRDCMEAAHKAGIWLFIGVHKQAAPSSNSHSLNAYLAIDGANRRIAAEYHKIHLFDQYPTRQQSSNNNSKQPLLLESSTTARGCKPPPTAIVSDQIRVGMAVCYDIRFPELSKYLVEQGQATVLTYPSAFTVPTGRDHWGKRAVLM